MLDAPLAAGTPLGTAPTVRRPVTGAVVASLLVFGAAVAVVQLDLYLDRFVSTDTALVLYGATQLALFGIVLGVLRWERRPLRDIGFVVRSPVVGAVLFSALLVLTFLVVTTYPGFLFGFGRYPTATALDFGFALLSAPLVALGQEAVFRGYALRTLSRAVSLPISIALSSAFFAVTTTNLLSLPGLGAVAAGDYLFGTTVANLVLGMVLALLVYKTRWSLVSAFSTRTGLLWVTTLMPVVARFPTWETEFAATLLAYGAVFAVVAFALQEPRLQAHRYLRETFGPRRLRFRERERSRREVRGTVATVGVLAVGLVLSTQLAPVLAGTGSSPPLLAIATGSMVPTLHRGTLVVVQHATTAQIHVGTIIAFHVSCLPAPTVHRVIRIVHGGPSPVYQTKGDANPAQDPCTVPYADVLGRVVAIVPYLGYLVLDPLLDAALVVLIVIAAIAAPRKDPWRSR